MASDAKRLRTIAIDALDQLSRFRALSDEESLALEECLKDESAIPASTWWPTSTENALR